MTRDYTNKEIEKILIIIFSVTSAITPYGIRLIKYYYNDISVSFLYSYTDLFGFSFGIMIVVLSEIKNISTGLKKFQVIIVAILFIFMLFLGISLNESYGKEIDKKKIEEKFVEFKIQNDSVGVKSMVIELKRCEENGFKMFLTSVILAGVSFLGLIIFMYKFRRI